LMDMGINFPKIHQRLPKSLGIAVYSILQSNSLELEQVVKGHEIPLSSG